MSDGPHKSLPMRLGWRKLAERAATSSFDPVQTAEAIPDALGDDWRHERCDDLIREVRAVLKDDRQGSLFGQQKEEKIEVLKKVSASGYPLRRLVLECVTQAVENGQDGADAVVTGTERALGERLARGNLQVEEHYRRSNSDRASAVRTGLQDAAAELSLKALTNRLLKTDDSSAPPAPKRDGLDDGVPLP
jgi:hypothetical protein